MDRSLQSEDSRLLVNDRRLGVSPGHGLGVASPMQAWGPSSTGHEQALSQRRFEPILSPRTKDVKPVTLSGMPGAATSPGVTCQPPVPKFLATTPSPDHCPVLKRPLAVTTTAHRHAASIAAQRAALRHPVPHSLLSTAASTRISSGYKGMRRSPWPARECRSRRSVA